MMKSKTATRSRPSPSLTQRAAQLQATHRFLEASVLRHKQAEVVLRTSGRCDAKVLQQSHLHQRRLRTLIRWRLSAQEAERKKLSHELQDEVAQTLLGLQVRLLTLKRAACGSAANLKKEITRTQRLVKDSVQSITRLAHALHIHKPA